MHVSVALSAWATARIPFVTNTFRTADDQTNSKNNQTT
jgi:hypothetical protein